MEEIIKNVKEKLANNQIDTETHTLISELDTYIMALSQGKTDFLAKLKFHFLPTSTFQEHALSNNWADEYLILSKNFDEIYQKINDTKFIKIKKLILLDFDIHEVSKLAYEVFLDHERDLNENQKTIIENLMLIDAEEGFKTIF
jgi:hypothetical protein